jgi:hypothetical protein
VPQRATPFGSIGFEKLQRIFGAVRNVGGSVTVVGFGASTTTAISFSTSPTSVPGRSVRLGDRRLVHSIAKASIADRRRICGDVVFSQNIRDKRVPYNFFHYDTYKLGAGNPAFFRGPLQIFNIQGNSDILDSHDVLCQ